MNDKFNVGDKVVVRRSVSFCGRRYRLGRVATVTPSGQIRLTDKSRFMPNGYRIGDVDEVLYPATEEHLELYEEQELRESVSVWANQLNAKVKSMKVPELKRVWATLGGVAMRESSDAVKAIMANFDLRKEVANDYYEY